eukprot:1354524-Rhodomonas_salina.2
MRRGEERGEERRRGEEGREEREDDRRGEKERRGEDEEGRGEGEERGGGEKGRERTRLHTSKHRQGKAIREPRQEKPTRETKWIELVSD